MPRYDVASSVISDLPYDARVWKESRSLGNAGFRLFLTGPSFDIERPRHRRDESGIDVLEVPLGHRDRPKSYVRRALALIRISMAVLRTRASVYHAHDIHVGPLSWTAARLRRAKLVYDAHELWGEATGAGLQARIIARTGAWIERFMVAHSDVVITTNPSRARELERRYGRRDIKVLANVPPLQEVVEPLDPGYPPGARVLLYQGRIMPEHRCFRETVEALAELDDDIHFVILGFGWDSARELIRGWARDADVEARVHFLPPRPWQELAATAAAATAGLVPLRPASLNDVLGDTNKLHEYLMGGLPVVASDFPEIRRIVTMTEPSVGELFDAEDPTTIAAAVQRLLADPELLAKRRETAREIATQQLNWDVEEKQLLSVYRTLLPVVAR